MNRPPPRAIRDLPAFADVRGWRKFRVSGQRWSHTVACHERFELAGHRWVCQTRFGQFDVVFFFGKCSQCGFGAWAVQLLSPLSPLTPLTPNVSY